MGINEQFNAMSKDSLSGLLEQAGKHAIFLLSSTGSVISCNKNAELVTGYTMQEMHGLDLLFFFLILYGNTYIISRLLFT